jgi:hypothetical protein
MGHCQIKKGIFKQSCKQSTEYSCIYCGIYFCIDDGNIYPQYAHVCKQKKCVFKFADLQSHKVWLKETRTLNVKNNCGQSNCVSHLKHTCKDCSLSFCSNHINFFRSKSQTELLLICSHCQDRKKIWDK